MKIILVLIAVTNGTVTTINTPLPDNATIQQCETIAKTGVQALSQSNENVKFLCMEYN